MQKFHVAALVIGLQGSSSIDYAGGRQRGRSLGWDRQRVLDCRASRLASKAFKEGIDDQRIRSDLPSTQRPLCRARFHEIISEQLISSYIQLHAAAKTQAGQGFWKLRSSAFLSDTP